MLIPGQKLRLPARSPACVFHVIEGAVVASIADHSFDLDEADTCCAPGYTPVVLQNKNKNEAAFLFMTDESPLHRKLGVYENRK